MARTAPYRHNDLEGTPCWTVNCSRRKASITQADITVLGNAEAVLFEALPETTERNTILWSSFKEVPVQPGVLDRNSQVALTTGQCVPFAVALHEATGFPYVAAFRAGLYRTPQEAGVAADMWDDPGFVHLMVQTPEGLLLDATGVNTADAYRAEWYEPLDLFELDEAGVDSLGGASKDEAEQGVIASFVPAALERYREREHHRYVCYY